MTLGIRPTQIFTPADIKLAIVRLHKEFDTYNAQNDPKGKAAAKLINDANDYFYHNVQKKGRPWSASDIALMHRSVKLAESVHGRADKKRTPDSISTYRSISQSLVNLYHFKKVPDEVREQIKPLAKLYGYPTKKSRSDPERAARRLANSHAGLPESKLIEIEGRRELYASA